MKDAFGRSTALSQPIPQQQKQPETRTIQLNKQNQGEEQHGRHSWRFLLLKPPVTLATGSVLETSMASRWEWLKLWGPFWRSLSPAFCIYMRAWGMGSGASFHNCPDISYKWQPARHHPELTGSQMNGSSVGRGCLMHSPHQDHPAPPSTVRSSVY